MAMKITCPHCKRGMLVPETMAGKKGKCKACQHILTVPALPADGTAPPPTAKPQAAKPQASKPAKPTVPPAPRTDGTPPSPSPPPPPPSADVEAEAAALLADEPKPVAEPVEAKFIDLNCPFCDEAIQLPADLAGKRAPCPECKNIIKVPELVKKDPKDWRKVEARGPSGARPTGEAAPEGAWSSTAASTVGRQSLMEAGILPTQAEPRTLWEKVRWPIVALTMVMLLGVGGWQGYRWWSQRSADRALKDALDYAGSPESKPPEKAALSIGAGEYYLHSKLDKRGTKANNQFGTALTAMPSVQGDDRDVLLGELVVQLIDLGGEKAETDRELALPWDRVQQLMTAVLPKFSNSEARLQALLRVAERLRARRQTARILPLTHQLYPGGDAGKLADKAAALAAVGLDFYRAGDRDTATKAANEAVECYKKEKDKPQPPLRAEVIALAELLDVKNAPKPDEEQQDDPGNEHVGKVAALAWKGEWDKARERAKVNEYGDVVQFRARLAVVEAAVNTTPDAAADLEESLKLAETAAGKRELSWPMLRLIRLALRAGIPIDRLQPLADRIGSRPVRGLAQLELLRAHLGQTKQAVEDSAADKVEPDTSARWLAAQALVRHNTRFGGNTSAVQGWPQPLKSFGSLGIALGLQDRGK